MSALTVGTRAFDVGRDIPFDGVPIGLAGFRLQRYLRGIQRVHPSADRAITVGVAVVLAVRLLGARVVSVAIVCHRLLLMLWIGMYMKKKRMARARQSIGSQRGQRIDADRAASGKE